MRKIQTQDVFKLARVIKRANLKDEIAKVVEETNAETEKEKISERVGIRVFLTIIENCSDERTEEMIYDLFGGIAEVPANNIKSQSLDVTFDMIKQIATENNMMNFFDAAGKLQQK